MLDVYDELRQLIATLTKQHAPYALCGGLALAVHGIPRATLDIDLLIPADALTQVSEIAQDLGYSMAAEPMVFADEAVQIHRLSKIDRESEDSLSLDLLLVTPKITSVWSSRQHIQWENQPLVVVSRRGLAELKSLRGSGQDLDDIERLKEHDDDQAH